MNLKLIYQLFTARYGSLRELRETEEAIIGSAISMENHNFVHAGVLSLADEMENLWEKSHELDTQSAEKWFFQVNASEVSDRLQIAESARNIRNRLWLLERGNFNMLPADFVKRVQAELAGKHTASGTSANVSIKTGGRIGNVHKLPVPPANKRSAKRFAQPARVLPFRRKDKK